MGTFVQNTEIATSVDAFMAHQELHWYALHTRARHERIVEQRLREHRMETFLPLVKEVHRWSDRKKKVEVPLFGCYVFVHCTLSPEDRTLMYRIDSVLGFVGAHGIGIPIPNEQIESVRAVLGHAGTWRTHPFLKVGQRVRVRGGALDGIEGVFLSENGDHSLLISIDAIQRSMAVRIDGYDIEPL